MSRQRWNPQRRSACSCVPSAPPRAASSGRNSSVIGRLQRLARTTGTFLDQAALNAQLPHAQQSAYESATAYLRKLRPLYQALNQASEWTALVASIREQDRNRPRFMELLDGLEGRSIVQAARRRRK